MTVEAEAPRFASKKPRSEQVAGAGRVDQRCDRLGRNVSPLQPARRHRAMLVAGDDERSDLAAQRGDGGLDITRLGQ